ncbi:hypothetical protein [Nostoc sp. 2RC]|uniref:hypothetical protein n=1 Tax=Nostoc sp. 2RC TaxID=2485484 RepID=UPI001623D467|nr:hypothetical protein [Nostoc sp. 2RC]MBC1237227.1 hypothetical protein [Nostoc sp. 2RC]
MLTLDRETTSAPSYSILNSSIKETFTAIDRFEWQAVDEILQMREQQLYREASYKTFEQYCQAELSAWGGYRRINQLLGAKKVKDTADELGEHIKNERQARSLLRLVKEPEKLKAAVAIALEENPSPSESDFAAAANKVVPRVPCEKTTEPMVPKIEEPVVGEIEEPIVPKTNAVTVTSPSHHRHGESGTIEADPPNYWQQIVTFADGSRELINNADLDASSVPYSTERTYPAEYAEAIAQLKQQHQQELERLEQELRIGLQTEATQAAQQQVTEQLTALQNLFGQQKEENIQLQQRLFELEGLRQLELENQRLQRRIQQLERAVEEPPANRRDKKGERFKEQENTFPPSPLPFTPEFIDLRSLALEPPLENAQECLRLMGIALGNLASAMNNTQALQAAALILGSEPTPSAIAYRMEQLQFVPQAVSEIRQVLRTPGCRWIDFWSVAQQYEVIKSDYWAELSTEETQLIAALEEAATEPHTDELVTQKAQVITNFEEVSTEPPTDEPTTHQTEVTTLIEEASTEPPSIGFGSIVAYADPYYTLYNARGEVVEDLGEEVIVAWDHWKDQGKKTSRYFKNELRFWQGKNN